MLSDAQLSRLTHGAPLPRLAAEKRVSARVPYTNAIRLYPLIGKGKFGEAVTVRCKDLGPAGCSFLTHQSFATDAKFLLKFPTSIGEKPLNLIGSMVRAERVSSSLNLVAVQFDAVPSEDVTPAPVTVAAERSAGPEPVAEASAARRVDDGSDSELSRIQRAVLDGATVPA